MPESDTTRISSGEGCRQSGRPPAADPCALSPTRSPLPAGVLPGPGETVGANQIVRPIAEGGMGCVYLALQAHPERSVALKMMKPAMLWDETARARFIMEAGAQAALEHRGILPVYHAGEDEQGRPYFTMKLATGGSLKEHLKDYGGKWQDIALLMADVAEAVSHAHERGVLHRDLKPANILFDGTHACVADFGLAKWTNRSSALSQTEVLIGTLAYMAPEAAREGASAATTLSDVYSLGAILYELLAGRRLFLGTDTEVLRQIAEMQPLAPSRYHKGVPADLSVIALKAVSKEPDKRYPSAASLAQDLRHWLAGRPIGAKPVTLRERTWKWARRNPLPASLAAILAVTLAAGGVAIWKKQVDLAAARDRAAAASSDAEDRVNFMVRTLPAKLQPLGRLDIMDEVFAQVSEHYSKWPADSAAAHLREAEFLIQWADALRQRSRHTEAAAKLMIARSSARRARELSPDDKSAAQVTVQTGWRLAEVIAEAKGVDVPYGALTGPELPDPTRVLEAAEADCTAALKQFGRTPQLLLERADLQLERANCAHLAKESGRDAIIAAVNLALTYREEAAAAAAAAGLPPVELRRSPERDPIAAQLLAHYAGDSTQAVAAWRQHLLTWEKICRAAPGDATLEAMRANARGLTAAALMDSDPGECRRLLQLADTTLKDLCGRDGSNVFWRASWASNARLFALLEKEDSPEALHWWVEMMARFEPLYQMTVMHKDTLERLRDAPAFAAQAFMTSDRKKAAEYYDRALLFSLRLAALVTTRRELDHVRTGFVSVAEIHEAHETVNGARKHLTTWLEQVRAEAERPGAPPVWKWAESMVLRRRTAFAASAAEKYSDNFAAFVSRANLLLGHPLFPDLARDTVGALTHVIGGAPGPQDVVVVTGLLQEFGRAGTFAAARPLDEIRKFAEALKACPEPIRHTIAPVAARVFFPSGPAGHEKDVHDLLISIPAAK